MSANSERDAAFKTAYDREPDKRDDERWFQLGWQAALSSPHTPPAVEFIYDEKGRRYFYDVAPPAPAVEPVALTDAQIEEGWHQAFSTSNPFCPCDLKSFAKAARWAEYKVRGA